MNSSHQCFCTTVNGAIKISNPLSSICYTHAYWLARVLCLAYTGIVNALVQNHNVGLLERWAVKIATLAVF